MKLSNLRKIKQTALCFLLTASLLPPQVFMAAPIYDPTYGCETETELTPETAASSGTIECFEGELKYILYETGKLAISGTGTLGSLSKTISITSETEIMDPAVETAISFSPVTYRGISSFFVTDKGEYSQEEKEAVDEIINSITAIDFSDAHITLTNGVGFFENIKVSKPLDVSNIDISEIKSLNYMFHNFELSNGATITGMENWDFSNIESIEYMFSGANITDADDFLSHSFPKLANATGLFAGCENLESADLTNILQSEQDMLDITDLFQNNISLTSVAGLDREKGTKCKNMFSNCAVTDLAFNINADYFENNTLGKTTEITDTETLSHIKNLYIGKNHVNNLLSGAGTHHPLYSFKDLSNVDYLYIEAAGSEDEESGEEKNIEQWPTSSSSIPLPCFYGEDEKIYRDSLVPGQLYRRMDDMDIRITITTPCNGYKKTDEPEDTDENMDEDNEEEAETIDSPFSWYEDDGEDTSDDDEVDNPSNMFEWGNGSDLTAEKAEDDQEDSEDDSEPVTLKEVIFQPDDVLVMRKHIIGEKTEDVILTFTLPVAYLESFIKEDVDSFRLLYNFDSLKVGSKTDIISFPAGYELITCGQKMEGIALKKGTNKYYMEIAPVKLMEEYHKTCETQDTPDYHADINLEFLPISYTLTGYDVMDLGDPVFTKTFTCEDNVSLPILYKEGYIHQGWQTSLDTEAFFTLPEGTTQDTTVYATWKRCDCSNTKRINIKTASCDAPGYTGDLVCTDCHKVLEKGEESPKTDHVYDEGEITKEPSYDEPGTTLYTCTLCGHTYTEDIPMLFASGDAEDSTPSPEPTEIPVEVPITYPDIPVKTTPSPSPAPTASAAPAAGEVIKGSGIEAKVLSDGSLLLLKQTFKGSDVKISSSVKISGTTYKVTQIAPKAFKGNKKIKSVSIEGGITKIGDSAFEGCTSLSKITIAKDVTTIGKQAFYKCKNLKTVVIKSKAIKKIGSKAFKGCKKGILFKVPKAKMKAYKKLLKGKY